MDSILAHRFLENPTKERLPDFVRELRNKHNRLTESVDYLRKKLPQEILVNGIPVVAYWVVNAYKDQGDVWRQIENTKPSWAISLSSTSDIYVIYRSAAGVDPVVWTAMLSIDLTSGVVIPGSITVGGITVTAFTPAGFVKNDAAGVLSGGNAITGQEISLVAAEVISGGRCVATDAAGKAIICSAMDATHINRMKGIAITAGIIGDTVRILTAGYMQDAGWAADPLFPIWLGNNGFFTQNPAGLLFWQQIGTVLSPTEILIDISQGIERS